MGGCEGAPMQQNRKPNWNKWRHVPNAKIWEAVALSLDIEPSKVEHSSTSWMAEQHMFEESEEFDDRIFVAGRNLGGGGLTPKVLSMDDRSDSIVSLSEFAAWSLSINWNVPPKFAELAAGAPTATDLGRPPALSTKSHAQQKPEAAGKDLRTKERGTLLKLILGMALAGYGYDPEAPRSATPKEIADDLLKHGISLTDDTVRQWLKTAVEEVEWHSSGN